MGMEKQNKRLLSKETLFTEWVFFCVYWGFFAIIWHFASYIETMVPGRSILYESNWLVPIASTYMYFMGAYVVFMDKAPDSIPIISRFARLFCRQKKTPPQC